MALQDIISSISNIVEQAKGITSNVQAITLPSIKTGDSLPAEIEATSPGDPAEEAPRPEKPMWMWYAIGGLALVILYLILRRR